jgi:hypothetical protein
MTTPVHLLEATAASIRSLAVYSELARDAKRRRGLNSFDAPLTSRLATRLAGDASIVAAWTMCTPIRSFIAVPYSRAIHSAPGTDGLSDAAIRARLERARRTRSLEHRDRSAVPLAEGGDIQGIKATNAIAKYGLTQLPSPRELAEI